MARYEAMDCVFQRGNARH